MTVGSWDAAAGVASEASARIAVAASALLKLNDLIVASEFFMIPAGPGWLHSWILRRADHPNRTADAVETDL